MCSTRSCVLAMCDAGKVDMHVMEMCDAEKGELPESLVRTGLVLFGLHKI